MSPFWLIQNISGSSLSATPARWLHLLSVWFPGYALSVHNEMHNSYRQHLFTRKMVLTDWGVSAVVSEGGSLKSVGLFCWGGDLPSVGLCCWGGDPPSDPDWLPGPFFSLLLNICCSNGEENFGTPFSTENKNDENNVHCRCTSLTLYSLICMKVTKTCQGHSPC